ncbi:MAG: hypothetical protein HN413_15420 [Chloroflexi bacterium]|jgi:site-specific recombinase|nr:hypothetical protein [Chloroflexota bacterium]
MSNPLYIDPSTGGMLFQVLAVIFAALSGVILFFSGRIKMFFNRIARNIRERGEEAPETNEEN